jgi:hypothetical protein
MLNAEPNTRYIVFPSWARYFTFRWEDLPGLLADPVNSGYLDWNDKRYLLDERFAAKPMPYVLLDGGDGGGIIVVEHTRRGPNWLGDWVIEKDADYNTPIGIESGSHCFKVGEELVYIEHVCYLTLRGDAWLRFLDQEGEHLEDDDQPWEGDDVLKSAGIKKRKPKEYECTITFEHVDVAGANIYWLVVHTRRRGEIKGLDEVPAWAAGFGLHVERVDAVDESIQREAVDWYADPVWKPADRKFVWYRVSGGSSGAGFQFAVLVYIALHLRMVGGSRLNAMHLVAQIEGEPHCMRDREAMWKRVKEGFESQKRE